MEIIKFLYCLISIIYDIFVILSEVWRGILRQTQLSANGAATSQPSPQGWVQDHQRPRGLKARHKMPDDPPLGPWENEAT
jgi:hypothetical protein